ncbi:hypothetical protein M0R45_030677 [Rubus argutus]|uniref:Uncharacterized protein n=1 Tax=Rubus argutus TaxID=59490 RepID=A0AAW1WFD9_RUBAR
MTAKPSAHDVFNSSSAQFCPQQLRVLSNPAHQCVAAVSSSQPAPKLPATRRCHASSRPQAQTASLTPKAAPCSSLSAAAINGYKKKKHSSQFCRHLCSRPQAQPASPAPASLSPRHRRRVRLVPSPERRRRRSISSRHRQSCAALYRLVPSPLDGVAVQFTSASRLCPEFKLTTSPSPCLCSAAIHTNQFQGDADLLSPPRRRRSSSPSCHRAFSLSSRHRGLISHAQPSIDNSPNCSTVQFITDPSLCHHRLQALRPSLPRFFTAVSSLHLLAVVDASPLR